MGDHLPSPGWYGDPLNNTDIRWWDGARWTHHTRPYRRQPPVPEVRSAELARSGAPVQPTPQTQIRRLSDVRIDDRAQRTGPSGRSYRGVLLVVAAAGAAALIAALTFMAAGLGSDGAVAGGGTESSQGPVAELSFS
jgi:hypothetical protein